MEQSQLSAQFQSYIALLRVRLSKKRFTHSVNVANSARELAVRWHADPDWAYLAGLLHDCCKELPAEEQEALMRSGSFPVEDTEWLCRPVWHGIAAAAYMQFELGIENREVLGAARWHTVGRANMTILEEIVYMADLISADRSYHDVDRIRKLAFSDLHKAMLAGVSFSIESVLKKGTPLPVCTAEAYNYYLRRIAARTKPDSK